MRWRGGAPIINGFNTTAGECFGDSTSLILRDERITASRAHRDWLNTPPGLDAFGRAVRESEMPEDSARDLLYIGNLFGPSTGCVKLDSNHRI